MSEDDKMDRRAFFSLGLRKSAKAAVELVEQRAEQKAKRFVRPPFALGELDFLIKCTRCEDCLKACPHDTIFLLPARLGVEIVGTPALDLVNGACHLCVDWPCASACTAGALLQPDDQQDESGEEASEPAPRSLPVLAVASIDTTSCLPWQGPECGACISVCPVPGAIDQDMIRPSISAESCIGCALCREACITTPKSITLRTR